MNTEHASEFSRRLSALAEIFDVKLSPARSALYFEALRDLPVEAVVGALGHAAKACTFFPKPAELRAFVVGDSEDVAEQAWLAFKGAVRRLGYMASVSIHDAALAESIVAVFGSWSQACTLDLSAEMWASKRKEFGRVYRVMRQRRLSGGRYLIGQAEQQNAGRRDWLRFVPVGRIALDGSTYPLALDEAERERQNLAAAAHAFARIDGESASRVLGPAFEECA